MMVAREQGVRASPVRPLGLSARGTTRPSPEPLLTSMQQTAGNQALLRVILSELSVGSDNSGVSVNGTTNSAKADLLWRHFNRTENEANHIGSLRLGIQRCQGCAGTCHDSERGNDGLEREAEHVGEVAFRSQAKRIGFTAPAVGRLAPQANVTVPGVVTSVVSTPGRPLDLDTRKAMEPLFGRDLQHVRVHTDASASASARAVRAKAYTIGHHLVFSANSYAPETADGRRLLAHEVTHAIQQAGTPTAVQRTPAGHELKATRFSGDPVLEDVRVGIRVLREGDRGPDVNIAVGKIQQALVDAGFSLPVFGVDGKFGPETKAAVKSFQTSGGLTGRDVDGILGVVTMGLLDSRFGPGATMATPDFARITDVDLTTLPGPNIVKLFPKPGVVQLTLDSFMAAGGTAKLAGGADCDKFQFGFIQICRPFDVSRAVYHSTGRFGFDIESDSSARLRAGAPLLDVKPKGAVFSAREDDDPKHSISARCASPGKLKPVDVLFTDKPAAAFALLPDAFIKSMQWEDFFFVVFSVILPDGTIRHMKSFFWDIHYCETFGAPGGGAPLGPSVGPAVSKVAVGNVIDGAPSEPGLSLAGKPATDTCNDLLHRTTPDIKSGTFLVTCGP